THWMRNFSPDLFSYNKISVINPFQAIDYIGISARESSPDKMVTGMEPPVITDAASQAYGEIITGNYKLPPVNFNVKVDKASYSGREKVRIDIFATDSEGRPVVSDLVMSLAKSFALNETGKSPESDIKRAGMDLPGRIAGITGINDHSNNSIDVDNPINRDSDQVTPEFLPEPDGHLISGKMISAISGEPLRNEDIVLSFVGKTALCRFSKTDAEGCFKFVTTEHGTLEVVIQPLSTDFDDYYVELDNPFPDSFSQGHLQKFSFDTTKLEEINNAIISMQVRRIYEPFLSDTIKNKDTALSPDFYGKADNTTLMSTFIELTSLKEAIKEIIPGVVTSKNKGKTIINAVFRFKDRVYFTNPLLLVDGVPVYDPEKVLAISLDKIEKVDVLNLGYIFSRIYLDGIIDITTYKGNLSEPVFDKPVFRQEFEALQQASYFSSPDYSTPPQRDRRIPDFRNTLYWNPDIKTDNQGMASVEFYTSDETGTYTILVEGFTTEGTKGKTVSSLTVTR
ncbi:MAG TPA: hypothetical protein VMV74_06000, partial [Bacteroidales bacterium]|nr:hypothetical protein [Bacteroidales bacterium]